MKTREELIDMTKKAIESLRAAQGHVQTLAEVFSDIAGQQPTRTDVRVDPDLLRAVAETGFRGHDLNYLCDRIVVVMLAVASKANLSFTETNLLKDQISTGRDDARLDCLCGGCKSAREAVMGAVEAARVKAEP